MERRTRTLWGEAEISYMLAIMGNKNIVKMLDGKRYRNGEIFHIVEEELKKRGFIKTIEQIRVKWKLLKSTYYKTVRQNSTSGSGRSHCPFYNELNELLGHRPLIKMVQEGVDTSSSMCSTSTVSENDTMFLSNSEAQTYQTVDVVYEELELETPHEEIVTEVREIDSPITSASVKEVLERECETPTTNRRNNSTLSSTLQKYTSEWKSAQLELQNDLLQKQKLIMAEEFQKQRDWEENLLRREQESYERMFMNISNSFFLQMGSLIRSSTSSNDSKK